MSPNTTFALRLFFYFLLFTFHCSLFAFFLFLCLARRWGSNITHTNYYFILLSLPFLLLLPYLFTTPFFPYLISSKKHRYVFMLFPFGLVFLLSLPTTHTWAHCSWLSVFIFFALLLAAIQVVVSRATLILRVLFIWQVVSAPVFCYFIFYALCSMLLCFTGHCCFLQGTASEKRTGLGTKRTDEHVGSLNTGCVTICIYVCELSLFQSSTHAHC